MQDGQANTMELAEFQTKTDKEIKEKQLAVEREKIALEREKLKLECAEKEEDRASRKRQREWEKKDQKRMRAEEVYGILIFLNFLTIYKELLNAYHINGGEDLDLAWSCKVDNGTADQKVAYLVG